MKWNKNGNFKIMKNPNKEKYKENNDINLNNFKTLNKNPSKNSKALFINNQNHIESINIINNNINYKNIILQNLPTSNKQYIGKDSSRNKNIKLEKNILFDYNNNINNNFQTIINKKQKSLNKNNTFKLVFNPSEQDNYNLNLNDNEMKYKLKLYEKNNIINKLKDELEYYKSFYHNANLNTNKNIGISNHNTINIADEINNNKNRLIFGSEGKNKILKTEDLRNKIKNIFSSRKGDIKYFGKNNNINNLKINIENDSETLNDSKINKESEITIQNKSGNKNRKNFVLSNKTFKPNNNSESVTVPTNNIFNRSNSNTVKRKLKLGLHLSELNLDNDKYNSIEADRNHASYTKNKKNIIHPLNKNLILRSINGRENDIIKFNYVIKFENLKRRMNNLVTNLFDLIEKKFNQ